VNRFEARLSIPLPQSWFAKESLTLIAPDGQANIIASSEPLEADIDAERYAQVQGDLLRREFNGYHEHSFEAAAAFGRHGFIRVFEWQPPDGVRVSQIQMYYAESGRGYTATATSPSTQFDRYAPQLWSVMDNITF
jgi:hypothetical protein